MTTKSASTETSGRRKVREGRVVSVLEGGYRIHGKLVATSPTRMEQTLQGYFYQYFKKSDK